MFLSKKGLLKIILVTLCYIAVGSLCMGLAWWLESMEINGEFLVSLGILMYLLSIFLVFFGRYAECKGKLISQGNQLIRTELRPAEFIKLYESVKNANDLVIRKPAIEILLLVTMAYDLLDDREHALAAADETIALAKKKKKAYAMLTKASLLFSYGEVDEAETLFEEAQKGKLDLMSKGLADAIVKLDRAKAMGDYKMVERNMLALLERKFPKPDSLVKLLAHYGLGEVYEKLQETEKAITHYRYCHTYGGETALKKRAGSALDRLQQ